MNEASEPSATNVPTPSARLTRVALICYGIIAVASAAALVLRGHERVFAPDPSAPLARFGLAGEYSVDLAVGLLLGLAIAALSQTSAPSQAMRFLSDRIRELLHGLTVPQAVLLALASAVGEELLFRGVAFEELLPRIGPNLTLVTTSLAFGAAHVGRDRRFLVWTGLSLAIGFLLGALRLATGSLLAPIALHATVNGLNLVVESWDQRSGSATAADTKPA